MQNCLILFSFLITSFFAPMSSSSFFAPMSSSSECSNADGHRDFKQEFGFFDHLPSDIYLTIFDHLTELVDRYHLALTNKENYELFKLEVDEIVSKCATKHPNLQEMIDRNINLAIQALFERRDSISNRDLGALFSHIIKSKKNTVRSYSSTIDLFDAKTIILFHLDSIKRYPKNLQYLVNVAINVKSKEDSLPALLLCSLILGDDASISTITKKIDKNLNFDGFILDILMNLNPNHQSVLDYLIQSIDCLSDKVGYLLLLDEANIDPSYVLKKITKDEYAFAHYIWERENELMDKIYSGIVLISSKSILKLLEMAIRLRKYCVIEALYKHNELSKNMLISYSRFHSNPRAFLISFGVPNKEIDKLNLDLSLDVILTIGDNPLHIAAQLPSPNLLKFLKEKNYCSSDQNCDGYSPLAYAIESENLEIIDILICGFEVDINEPCLENMSPLDLSLKLNHLSVVNYLLDKGALVNNRSFEFALSCESREACLLIGEELLKSGNRDAVMDILDVLFNSQDKVSKGFLKEIAYYLLYKK